MVENMKKAPPRHREKTKFSRRSSTSEQKNTKSRNWTRFINKFENHEEESNAATSRKKNVSIPQGRNNRRRLTQNHPDQEGEEELVEDDVGGVGVGGGVGGVGGGGGGIAGIHIIDMEEPPDDTNNVNDIVVNNDDVITSSENIEEMVENEHPLSAIRVSDPNDTDFVENLPIIDGVAVTPRHISEPLESKFQEQKKDKKKKSRNKKRKIIICVIILVIISITTLVTLFVLQSKRQQNSINQSNIDLTPAPSPAVQKATTIPSSAPTLPSTSSPTSSRFQMIATAIYQSLDPPRPLPSSWNLFNNNNNSIFNNNNNEDETRAANERAMFRAMQWLADEDEAMLQLPSPTDDQTTTTTMMMRLRQRYGLALLYFAMNGDSNHWKDDCGFLSKEHECNWNRMVYDAPHIFDKQTDGPLRGAICGSDENEERVRFVLLMNMNITGFIPDEIDLLQDVVFLSVGNNALTGSIPSNIWNLPHLLLFRCEINKLSGTIPPITNHSKLYLSEYLAQIDLSQNRLSGTIPPSLLTNNHTRELDITFNLLTGTIPTSSDPYLVTLALNGNPLTGTLPFRSGSFPNLKLLSFDNDLLHGTLDPLVHLSSLSYLSLFRGSFHGTIPEGLSLLTDLKLLSISANNNVTGSIPSSFSSLTKLTSLAFMEDNLSGTLPSNDFFENMDQLKFWFMGNNRLSGTLPSSLSQTVQMISLFDNEITGTIPDSFGRLTNMVELALFQNMLNGTLSSSLGDLVKLKSLQLDQNRLEGTLPSSFVKLTSLKKLTLQHNNLEGDFGFLCAKNSIRHMEADCLGSEANVNCSCCASCCADIGCTWNDP